MRWNRSARHFEASRVDDALFKAVCDRYGVPAPGDDRDTRRQQFTQLLSVLQSKPEAGKDRELITVIAGLIAPAEFHIDKEFIRKAYIEFPLLDRESGLQIWKDLIVYEMASTMPPGELIRLGITYAGYDVSLFKEAASALQGELGALANQVESDDVDGRLFCQILAIFLGHRTDATAVRDLIEKAKAQSAPIRSSLDHWAWAFCETANTVGLRLLLESARTNPHMRAAQCADFSRRVTGPPFDQAAMYSLKEDEQLAKVAELMAWLDENEARLQWDQANRIYVLPADPAPRADHGANGF
jgi:hypothetical protein